MSETVCGFDCWPSQTKLEERQQTIYPIPLLNRRNSAIEGSRSSPEGHTPQLAEGCLAPATQSA